MKLLLVFFALASTALAKPPSKPVPLPGDVRVVKDLAYLPADRKEKADLYLPPQRNSAFPLL